MRDVIDFAKYFIKNGADSVPNTYDGNMKLQKLLAFANMINIAEYGVPLYGDNVLAFKDGFVVEKIRLRYQNDYANLKADSDRFEPDFTSEEYSVLIMTLGLFGDVPARQLSDLSHTFQSWQLTYPYGMSSDGYHSKKKSIVDFNSYPEDIQRIKKAVDAFKRSQESAKKTEVINGITFYYDDMTLTPEIFDELEMFSRVCDDDAYTVYMDEERLVIY